MIKIKYILLCLLCLLALRTGAQSLVAYHVVGKVTYMVNGVSKPLVMSTKVNGNTRVNIPYGGKVEFLDEKNKKRIIIKTPGQGRCVTADNGEGQQRHGPLAPICCLREEATQQYRPCLAETLFGFCHGNARN